MTYQSNIPATEDPAFHAQIAGLKEMWPDQVDADGYFVSCNSFVCRDVPGL